MSNKFFSEIKKNFGFGCMRFPTIDDRIDLEQVTEMVTVFWPMASIISIPPGPTTAAPANPL